MHTLSGELKSCIDACQRCYAVCLQTAMSTACRWADPIPNPNTSG
jgi:hypothetical protein